MQEKQGASQAPHHRYLCTIYSHDKMCLQIRTKLTSVGTGNLHTLKLEVKLVQSNMEKAAALALGVISVTELFSLATGKHNHRFLELFLQILIADLMLKNITEIEIRGLFLFPCLDAHDFDGVSILTHDKLLFNLL